MKLNIANPSRGLQKTVQLTPQSASLLFDKRIGDRFDGSLVCDSLKDFVFQITGGDDKQGFPMTKRLNTSKRVRLLLKKGDTGYRCRRDGCRMRKSVRGNVVSSEIATLSVIVLQEGHLEGLTDSTAEQTHLPKRADKLRAMFNISEEADLKKELDLILKQASSDGKIPNIKITRLRNQEKEKKIEESKREKMRKKALFEKEKAEYERKYRNILAKSQ